MQAWVDDSGFDEGGGVYLCIDQLRFRVPDANDNYPMEWWHIEAITNVAASQVARAWRGRKNAKLDYIVKILDKELTNYDYGTFGDVHDFRREIVGKRWGRGYSESTERIKPAIFTERNDVSLEHIIRLLEDVWGQHRGEPGYLYAVPGETRYVPAIVWLERGRFIIKRLEKEGTTGWVLRRTIRFSKPGKRPKAPSPDAVDALDFTAVRSTTTKPSRELIQDVMEEPCEWPILNAIIRIPSLRADGSILDQKGYDPATRTWYDPDPIFDGIKVPDAPTIDDVLRARDVLAYPLREFPLVHGYASPLAIILERVCMPMLNGPRPLHIIDAPKPGSGKSTLAKVLTTCVTGNEGGGVTWPKGNDAEMEKIIGAAVRKGNDVGVFDNIVDDEIGPPSLAKLITARNIDTRTLGKSDMMTLLNLMTWMATLNRARVNEDFQRRSILTTIDPSIWGITDPTKRVVEDDQILETCKANRPLIIQAALTLARNWVVLGQPRDPALVGALGGFERWLHVVGGILWTAGITGLPASIKAVANRNVAGEEDEMFLDLWRERYGYGDATTTQLAEMAATNGLYLKTMAKEKGQWIERRFKSEILDRLLSEERCLLANDRRPWRWLVTPPRDNP